MAPTRKILIADPDLAAVRALSRALRQRGWQVHYAPDGARALELAVLRHPDLALFDEACRMLDARTFIQILRTNPRTLEIPVVVSTARFDADRLRGLRDGVLRKPFNLDEVLARLEHLFRRAEAARELKEESQEIEGALGQLGIPDLAQILAMNRRSGRLALARGAERGEVWLAEGRPVHARVGRAEGEKALFRLLVWTEGTFSFTPGTPPPRGRIQRAMDDALLEAMRQADEVNRLGPSLPPRTARLALAPDAALPPDMHPVTQQVVELLGQPRPLGELLDLAPATDLEVLGAVAALLQRGVARVEAGRAEAAGRGPLLQPAELHALRSRVLRGKGPQRVACAKVFLCGGAAAARRLFQQLPELVPVDGAGSFGTLARLELGEVLRLDFCALPAADAARPLWRPFTAGAVGALVLEPGEAALRLARYLAFEVRVPVGVLGGELPAALEGAPAGARALGDDPVSGLRALLEAALHPPGAALPTPAADAGA